MEDNKENVQRALNHLSLQSCSEAEVGTARNFASQEAAQRTVQRALNHMSLQSCSEAEAGTARFYYKNVNRSVSDLFMTIREEDA